MDPDMRGGKPRIRGMRITVYDILGYFASGMSQEEILASLAFAADFECRFVAEPSF